MTRPTGAHGGPKADITSNRMYSLSRTRCGNPKQGRMLAVDNFVQSPYSSQGYNRYSYVHNSPLSYVDPSGENGVGTAIQAAIAAVYAYLSGAKNNADSDGNWNWNPANWSQFQVGVAYGNGGLSGYVGFGDPNGISMNAGGNFATGAPGGGLSGFGMPSYTQAPSAIRISWDLTELNYQMRMLNRPVGDHTMQGTRFGSGTNVDRSDVEDLPTGDWPTENDGGFIDDRTQFLVFMYHQANVNPVEVGAFEILDKPTGNHRFFVQPWKGNTRIYSNNQFALLFEHGYRSADVIAQYHTHPGGGNMSFRDAFRSYDWRIPVHAIMPNGHIWTINQTVMPIQMWDGWQRGFDAGYLFD